MLEDDFVDGPSVQDTPDAAAPEEVPPVSTPDAAAPDASVDAGDAPDASTDDPDDTDDDDDIDAGADIDVPDASDAGTEQPPPTVVDAGNGAPDAGETCVPGTEVCDGRDNDCDELVDETTACPANCDGLTLEGRGAMFCGGAGVTFATAETRCSAQGMRLVGLDSLQKNNAVVQAAAPLYSSLATLVEEQDAIWFDARDTQTEGTWLRGQPATVFWIGTSTGAAQGGAFVNWGAAKPNNNGGGVGEDCGVLYIGSGTEVLGTWNDHLCTTVHTFLCEAAAP